MSTKHADVSSDTKNDRTYTANNYVWYGEKILLQKILYKLVDIIFFNQNWHKKINEVDISLVSHPVCFWQCISFKDLQTGDTINTSQAVKYCPVMQPDPLKKSEVGWEGKPSPA